MDNNLSYQRRCAVSKAWAKERQQVLNSHGSRNWSQKEQKEILRTGKCHGYEGQHMLSVKAHPEHAGNEKNIQFLTHDEHFKAHQGNWKNDANGKYNLKTGKVDPFSDGIPSVKYKKLSDPISERSKTIANNRYIRDHSAHQSRSSSSSNMKLPVRKTETTKKQNSSARSRALFKSKVSGNPQSNTSVKSSSPSKNTEAGKPTGHGQGT